MSRMDYIQLTARGADGEQNYICEISKLTFTCCCCCFIHVTRRYKTEYKKKFRPFSLYQYVDGRFQKSSSDKIPTSSTTVDGPATAPPRQSGDKMDKDTWYGEVLELRKKAGEYKVSHPVRADISMSSYKYSMNNLTVITLIDIRRGICYFSFFFWQYRGLGGELMSDHMADLYAKQFDVWEQVSRRSSLSALALAATSPRYYVILWFG